MKHVYLFYFFISFLTGIVSLSIVTFIYGRTRETIIRYYLYFYSTFTLFVVTDAIFSYIRFSLPISQEAGHTLHYVVVVTVASWVFALLVFTHTLFAVQHATLKNVLCGGVALILAIENYVVKYVILDETVEHVTEYIESIVFFCVYVYILVLGFYAFGKIQEPSRKTLAKKFLILSGIGLPGVLGDTFLDRMLSFRLLPIFYWGMSIVFTHHFLKCFASHPQILPQPSLEDETERARVEDLFEQYNLSPREQDVVRLIVQGHRNQQIAETLSVTVSTIKKYITRIYYKFGIKSRYELIALFKDTSNGTN